MNEKDILRGYMQRYTGLSKKETDEILEKIPVKNYKKGELLLEQGDYTNQCFFVLKGCIRQYSLDEEGKEVTYNFFTEEQTVMLYNTYISRQPSKYALACTEDCVLVVGNLDEVQDMYDEYKELEALTRRMIESNMGTIQEEYAEFLASSPEERYRLLLQKRPTLVTRVPQHQLASYLGITPESLSRIKKRIHK